MARIPDTEIERLKAEVSVERLAEARGVVLGRKGRDLVEAAGGRVLGREVSVDVAGVRTRPDLFVELPCGTRCLLEVKTGPGARLTPNQATGFPGIRAGGGVPKGPNAAAAGLAPGVPMGPTLVWVVHQPWPL